MGPYTVKPHNLVRSPVRNNLWKNEIKGEIIWLLFLYQPWHKAFAFAHCTSQMSPFPPNFPSTVINSFSTTLSTLHSSFTTFCANISTSSTTLYHSTPHPAN